jgi:hypothetical protein
MGTDVIGGPHDFLPPRSDKFQKLCGKCQWDDTKTDKAGTNYTKMSSNSLQNEYTSTMSSTTSSSGLFMVSHPHRQVSSLWSHTHIVKWALYGLTPTLSSGLFMVSHPHRQVGSLWSHTHIIKWALYGLTPTSSSGLFMVSHPHRQVGSLWSIS